MKRRFYIELDEEYIPIFKACGITAPFSDFKEQILCKDCIHRYNEICECWNLEKVELNGFCERARKEE